jgi:hypothetical protein
MPTIRLIAFVLGVLLMGWPMSQFRRTAAQGTACTMSAVMTRTPENAVSGISNGTPGALNRPLMTFKPIVVGTASIGTTGSGSATVMLAATPVGPVTAGVSASPTSIASGQLAIITWTTKNAVRVTLNGTPVALNGSLAAKPSMTTTYKVVATGSTGTTDWGSATVRVIKAPEGAVAAGVSASPTSIASGQASVITWTTKNAVRATLNGKPAVLNGSLAVKPTTTTTYKVVATGSTGTTDWGSATVTVNGNPTPTPTGAVAAAVNASPTSIVSGQSSVVTWTTKNAARATLNGRPVALNGSLAVKPTTTTTYKVVATGSTGTTDWGSATVTLAGTSTPAVAAGVSASPTSIMSGPSSPPADTDRSSAVRYVSPTGSDTGDGSRAHPWATIGHADSVVMPGATVVVLDGKYVGDITLASNGFSGRPITYVAEHKWRAKLVGNTSGDGTAIVRVSGSHIIIKDFDITGTEANGIILAYKGNTAKFNQAMGNYVHDIVTPCDSNSGSALNSGGGDNYIGISHMDFIGNVVSNVTPYRGCPGGHAAVGIHEAMPFGLIINNIVINSGYGIQCWHAASNETIADNILINNLRGITVGAGDSPGKIINDNTVVQRNIIIGTSSWAIAETGKTGLHNRYLDNMLFNNQYGITLQNGLLPSESAIESNSDAPSRMQGLIFGRQSHTRSDW